MCPYYHFNKREKKSYEYDVIFTFLSTFSHKNYCIRFGAKGRRCRTWDNLTLRQLSTAAKHAHTLRLAREASLPVDRGSTKLRTWRL